MTPSTLTPKSDEIIKHLTPKATRCPECGSSDVVTGIGAFIIVATIKFINLYW